MKKLLHRLKHTLIKIRLAWRVLVSRDYFVSIRTGPANIRNYIDVTPEHLDALTKALTRNGSN